MGYHKALSTNLQNCVHLNFASCRRCSLAFKLSWCFEATIQTTLLSMINSFLWTLKWMCCSSYTPTAFDRPIGWGCEDRPAGCWEDPTEPDQEPRCRPPGGGRQPAQETMGVLLHAGKPSKHEMSPICFCFLTTTALFVGNQTNLECKSHGTKEWIC